MRSLTLALLFVAGATAMPQDVKQYGWRWSVGGTAAGTTKSWEGGDVRGTRITPNNTTTAPAPVQMKLAWPIETCVQDWMRDSLARSGRTRDVTLAERAQNGSIFRGTEYSGCTLTSITFPEMSSTSAQEGEFALQFEPTAVTINNTASVAEIAQKGATLNENAFTFEVTGLESGVVTKVGAIRAVGPRSLGLRVENFIVTITERTGDRSWRDWFETFLVQGNLRGNLKTATATWRKSDRSALFTLQLNQVGILRMSRIDMRNPAPAQGADVKYEVELYCQNAEIPAAPSSQPPAPATNTPPSLPPPPSTNVQPPPVNPPATDLPPPATTPDNPDDKGARDPAGLPRFAQATRTAFSSSSTKETQEENAEYVTKIAPDKVETWFAAQMKDATWDRTARQETGNPKDASYLIELWYARDTARSKVALGKTADGRTTITVRVTTSLK